MPNRSRARGDYFERRTRAALEADGWLVIRSAGSLGVADLVALQAEQPTMLISCKLTGHLPRSQGQTLMDTAVKAGALPVLAQRLRPGWVGLHVVSPLGTRQLAELHMPARQVSQKATPDGLSPAGEQLPLPYG